MNLRATWTVFRFEFSRTLSTPRLIIMSALALFPALLMLLIQVLGGEIDVEPRSGIALFVLIPEVLVIMGLLLWAAPVVYSEVEGKTWSYLAVSPAGRSTILLGKYLNAALWTTITAWTSLVLSLAVVFKTPHLLHLGWVLALLSLMASLAYGAVYTLIGVIFLKRAIAVAVAYTLIAEVIIGTIPIVINISQITVQYHLRSMLVKWMDWDAQLQQQMSGVDQIFTDASPSLHVLSLLVFTAVFLVAAAITLRQRELVIADRG